MITTADPPTVYLVDDDSSVREAISSLVRSVGFNVETFSSAVDFLEHVRPGVCACLVLDVRMPRMSGLDLQRKLQDLSLDIPIIFITGHGDIPMAVRAIKSGAVEFLPKPFRDDDLLDAIDKAINLDRSSRENRAEQDRLKERYARLTPREKEVFPFIVKGLLNKQIAWNLGVAEVTVKVHKHNIIKKMGMHTLADLVRASQKLSIGEGIDTNGGMAAKD